MSSTSDTGTRVAIITGGGSGIGRATAERFSREGCAVLVADIDAERARSVAQTIKEECGTALGMACDVSSRDDCAALSARAIEEWGRLDFMVANAGVQRGGQLSESTDEDWRQILDVNLRGAALCCEYALSLMAEQGSGAIVLTSSINAIRGVPGMAIYDVSKAGILGLMRSLATDYGSRGVRVNAVCPGTTITDFHIDRMAQKGKTVDDIREMFAGHGLLGRAAEPPEIASAIWFLASDEASYITGQALVVDGGLTVTTGD